MAEMNKEPAERINFANAKSLFEKDKIKVPKSASWTTSSSTGPLTQINIANGDKMENKVKDPLQSPSSSVEDSTEPWKTSGTFSSSFDSSTDAPKLNFVLPKKRGDTSDLRWLTAVHNSKPLGTAALAEKAKSNTNDTNRGPPRNQVHMINGATLPASTRGDTHNSAALVPQSSSSGSLTDNLTGEKASKDVSTSSIGRSTASMHVTSRDYPDSGVVKLRSSSVKAATSEAPRSASNTTAAVAPKIGQTPSGNWKSRKEDHTLEKVENTSIVKSSMTVTLNTGGVGGVQEKGVESVSRTASGFSAVLEEIQSRKITTIAAESHTKIAGSSMTAQPPSQGLHPLQAPSLHAAVQPQEPLQPPLPRQAPPAPAVSHQQQFPHPGMSERATGDENLDEDGHRRVKLMNWNPTKLMQELYKITLQTELEAAGDYINMEGYLEKLPISKAKDTFLKTWKRRYFKAHNGTLHYYESVGEKKESGNFKLNGGRIEEIGERMLGIEDGRGHYLVLRCASETDYGDWRRALQSQTVEGIQSSWVKPILRSSKSNAKKVIILELGSCAIRAGILGESVALPDLFLPTIVATHRETGQRRFCFDALLPDVRACSTISYPVRPTARVDKYSIDWDSVPGLFDHVFHELKVDPSQYSIMFSIPTSFSDKIKSQFIDLFVNRFNVGAINMVCQTILSLYSYNATSGVVVDIGDRIEILPVADGYVVEGGVMRVPYGGQMITDALNRSFTDRRYRFCTDVEFQIVRLAMEKLCYVSSNYESEMKQFQQNPEKFNACMPLDTYDLPTGSFKDISNDLGRFRSPEGLFDTFFWGLDNPPIQEMIQKAIQTCPIDMRRQMWRSIYLSGGATSVKGFAERLQAEISKLSPSAVVVQVHAAPNRYHSSYLGASALALMPAFDDACISASEWRQSGANILKKWRAY